MLFIKNNAYSIVILGKLKSKTYISILWTMQFKSTLIYLCLFCNLYGFSQKECLLGIGGKDNETITEVFQLNEDQQEKLKDWSAELKVRNDILKDQAKFLMKQHEESSPEVLMTISLKYKGLLDSMRQNLRILDTRMLSVFNQRQYERYLELCRQLTLRPIYVDRSVDEK